MYDVEGDPVLVVVRGDHQLNEIKLQKLFPGQMIAAASEEFIKENVPLQLVL